MKFHLIAGAMALALVSGCVTVPIVPQTGGEFPAAGPSTLASAVAGRAFINNQTGQVLNLWSDGTYTMTTGSQQAFGTWRTNEANVTMCFTGPVAAYANGACVPVRYDSDFLSLYDASRSFVVEAWAVS